MAPRVLDETRVRNLLAPEEAVAARAHRGAPSPGS